MSLTSTGRRRALEDGRWVQPVQGYAITTPYGKAGSRWSSGAHTGADFACPTGTPVRAVAAGRVSSTGWAGAYGNRVVVVHKPGLETWYCHLSHIGASRGEQIVAGTVVGAAGETGNTTGPHLHLEVRVNGQHRDPAPYLSGAVDAPSTPTYNTGAQPADTTTNPALVNAANSNIAGALTTEVRRLTIVATVVIGGVALIAVGIAQGSKPRQSPRRSS